MFTVKELRDKSSDLNDCFLSENNNIGNTQVSLCADWNWSRQSPLLYIFGKYRISNRYFDTNTKVTGYTPAANFKYFWEEKAHQVINITSIVILGQ